MQRLLCEKLLSKIPRNGFFSTNSSLISPKSASSTPFFKTNANAIYQHLCSEHSTISCSRIWKIRSPNGVSRNFLDSGSLSSVVARRFLLNSVLKGGSKFPARIHSARSFQSLDSRHRSRRSVFRRLRLTSDGVLMGLIMTNVSVFVLWNVADREFMVKNFMVSVDNFTSGRLHTLITCAFSHISVLHIMFNMIALYSFGGSIGQTFGPQYLLKLYLSGAVAGSIFYLLYHAFVAPSIQNQQTFTIDHSRRPALGASGAVNAIMLLHIFLYPKSTVLFSAAIPMPAFLLGILVIGQDIWRASKGDEQVSGSAHLGGATVAALAWLRSRRGRFRRF